MSVISASDGDGILSDTFEVLSNVSFSTKNVLQNMRSLNVLVVDDSMIVIKVRGGGGRGRKGEGGGEGKCGI